MIFRHSAGWIWSMSRAGLRLPLPHEASLVRPGRRRASALRGCRHFANRREMPLTILVFSADFLGHHEEVEEGEAEDA